MDAMSHPVSTSLNGGGMTMGNSIDPSTINPATLNPQMLSTQNPNHPQASPRGLKRSRSPEMAGDSVYAQGDDDDAKPRKRGRPPKVRVGESPRPMMSASTPRTAGSMQSVAPPVQTPQMPHQVLPHASPPAVSPPKSTPTKGTVIKALPTVRDHTTDQLNPEGDEFIPREIDEAGERKVAPNGTPLDGREYVCRTFCLPNRGDKLFMLATECARNLNYRDSYLLFNKNRSLYKIIATQTEKEHLIQQEVLPYSYRSRQIAIVTARSMYRQFGSRLVQNGRKVRDDYWESKARKQGFTEDDLAGEKRPGGAKKREAAAAEAGHTHALTALPHGEIIYSNGPSHLEGHPGMTGLTPNSLASLPMILAPNDEVPLRDYGNVQRPRQEMSGQAYQDRTQSSSSTEILNQAAQTAEFNRTLGQQRNSRSNYIKDYWHRPHDPPTPQRPGTAEGEGLPVQPQIQSPPMATSGPMLSSVQQSTMPQHSQHQVMPQPGYGAQAHTQNPMQSPMRAMHQQPQMQPRTPGMMHPGVPGQQQPSYAYAQNQMFHPPQPQPSPLSQSHPSMAQYAHQQQHSPHPQPSPMHAPQMHHQNSGMQGQAMGYQGMAGMPGGAMNRQLYGQQHSPSPQHFMHQGSPPAQQPGMQGWNQGQSQHMQQWQGFQ